MSLELKDIIEINTKGKVYYLCFNGIATCMINQSPLADCQIYSIANMCVILQKPEPLQTLKFIRNKISKAQMLFNVNQNLMKQIREIVPANMIVIEEPYTSTNNSEMCMYLVKTEFLK